MVTIADVKAKLKFIQDNQKETILFPYLQELFLKMGYQQATITHGRDEFGKDLVLKQYDEKLEQEKYTAVVVKNKNVKIDDFSKGGEVDRQISNSFQHPFIDESGGKYFMNDVVVVINGSISFNARQILSESFHQSQLVNIKNWDYQSLANKLLKHTPSFFLSNQDPKINKFLKKQEETFLKFNGQSKIYHGLSVKDINDVYVNVRTTFKRYQETIEEYSEYDKPSRKRPYEELDDSIAISNSNKSYVIHGIPTSGKTLLLRRIGYNSCIKFKHKPTAPFLIELCNVNKKEGIDFWKMINEIYRKVTDGENFEFTQYSKITLLLDGIDEILDSNERIELISKIEEFKEWFSDEYPDYPLQIVLSTRDIGFIEKNNVLIEFEKIELLPFDVGQAFKLVKKIMPNNKVKAEKFVNAIKDNQLSNNLTRTPMALSLMAILYKEEEIDLDELPANITELYNKFCDYYLNRWDTSKGISLQYKFEETKQILGLIARHMHENGLRNINPSSLIEFLTEVKKEFPYEDLNDINQFLTALKERSGIVHYDQTNELFYFNHTAFQEYFVSISFDDATEVELLDQFFNIWWSNVIVFYCGKQPKRDIFIKKVAESMVPTDIGQYFVYLNQLSRCIQANYLVGNSVKKEVAYKIVQGFDLLYKNILEFEKIQGVGILYNYTILDLIVQLRDYLKKLVGTKHLNIQILSEIFNDVFANRTKYKDITLYSLAYFLSFSTHDAFFLQEFIKDNSLDPRWQRIVYIDIDRLTNKKNVDLKLFRKIKQKQLKHKQYIQKQLSASAYKYLLPLVQNR